MNPDHMTRVRWQAKTPGPRRYVKNLATAVYEFTTAEDREREAWRIVELHR